MHFGDRTVIVSGASRGIGFEIARKFLEEGANVFATARNTDELDSAVKRLAGSAGSIRGVVADSTDQAAVEEVLRQALAVRGRVDALINNVGLYTEGAVLALDAATLHESIHANVAATLVTSKVVGKQMVKQRSGAIVNVASLSGHGADGESAAYSTAKAGVVALTRALAVELGRHNIRCNSVSPAYVDTEKLNDYPSEFQRWVRKDFARAPLGRIATAREVAAVCAFLASDEASAVSGIDIKIDCGQSAHMYVAASMPVPAGP
jgi:NAD(P)-dependent dehydrogenase (short-subunit alcohol dehydrogenase family)